MPYKVQHNEKMIINSRIASFKKARQIYQAQVYWYNL